MTAAPYPTGTAPDASVPADTDPPRLPSFGLGARLGIAVSLLILVVCITQSWILAERDMDHIRRFLGDRGHAISEQLAREAGTSLPSGDVDALQRLAEEARAQSGIVYSRIFDRDGLLLVSVGTPPGGAALRRTATADDTTEPVVVAPDVWEFRAPVLATEARHATASRPDAPAHPRVGTVAVGVSVESLQALRRRAFTAGTFFAVLFALIATISAAVLARAMTRPLKALASAADRIARGDLDTRVEVSRSDEVGALGRSFNAMVQSLARSRTTLDEYSRALEEKVRELETANHLKSEFLATVSHELRTPLNVIIGYAEMLASSGSAVRDDEREMIATIQRYSKLQLDLITSVLDFSRLNAGELSFQVERFDVAPLLDEIQTLFAPRLQGSGLQLRVGVEPNVPTLETDRVKLQEILRNLVDNAVKFTEAGTITLTARFGADPTAIAIDVSDTGVGIPEDGLPHVFDPFHQVGASSTRRTGGVGLGLSIVKQLTEALGGTVSVVSQIGAGSTFHIDLPCRFPGASPVAPDAQAPDAVAALDDVTRNAATLPERTRPLRRRRQAPRVLEK